MHPILLLFVVISANHLDYTYLVLLKLGCYGCSRTLTLKNCTLYTQQINQVTKTGITIFMNAGFQLSIPANKIVFDLLCCQSHFKT